MSEDILPIVLCGGSGTRLWPLSRKNFPKQFVPIIDGKSLLQLTLERIKLFSSDVRTVTSEKHRFFVKDAAEAAAIEAQHILESSGHNTAPAMTVAALLAEPEQLLLFTPADHHLPDAQGFVNTIRLGIPAAKNDYIVTFGVNPAFPSTAYGYIKTAEWIERQQVARVDRFIEKPTEDFAKEFLLAGRHYWNTGVFLVKAKTLLGAVLQYAPDILQSCRNAVDAKRIDGPFIRLDPAAFNACRSESIDYAVLEHHNKIAMVPFLGQWSDVGSWNAMADLTQPDAQANRISGQGRALQARNTYIHAPHRLVVALGTQNLMIIDTQDAILVTTTAHAEQVKALVVELERDSLPQTVEHRHVVRPWGMYDCVSEGERFKVKRITVKAGGKLSLQMHHHRAEHWVVVRGTARVIRGDEIFLLSENQSTYIPIGTQHRLENPGKTPLEIIEIQSGSYLDEDDIIRFEDNYGRG